MTVNGFQKMHTVKSGIAVRRLILFFMFAIIAVGVIFVVSGHTQGSSGPIMGFLSWAFLLGRSAGVSIPITLLICFSYFLGLFGLITITAKFDKAHSPIVPILLHCLGAVIAALTFGPLLIDEPVDTFLLYLILSLIISIVYILVDWRLAVSGFRREHSEKSITGGT